MDEQLRTFHLARAALSDIGIHPELAHISNSAALLRNRSADLNMVRAGICLYGIPPSEHVGLFDGMQPALEWRATVQHIAFLSPGDRTGYGGTYVATEHERIAILPIGYADGYPRALSNVGWVGFQGTTASAARAGLDGSMRGRHSTGNRGERRRRSPGHRWSRKRSAISQRAGRLHRHYRLRNRRPTLPSRTCRPFLGSAPQLEPPLSSPVNADAAHPSYASNYRES